MGSGEWIPEPHLGVTASERALGNTDESTPGSDPESDDDNVPGKTSGIAPGKKVLEFTGATQRSRGYYARGSRSGNDIWAHDEDENSGSEGPTGHDTGLQNEDLQAGPFFQEGSFFSPVTTYITQLTNSITQWMGYSAHLTDNRTKHNLSSTKENTSKLKKQELLWELSTQTRVSSVRSTLRLDDVRSVADILDSRVTIRLYDIDGK